MAAERRGVEAGPSAAVRTGLPPGATVADLIAALAGRSAPAPLASVPLQDRRRGVESPRLADRPPTPPATPGGRPPTLEPPAPRRPPGPAPGPELVLFTHGHHVEPAATGDERLVHPVRRPTRTRPPIGDDLSLFGLSRRSRSRVGSRLFTLFFTLVFGLIFVQMIASILYP